MIVILPCDRRVIRAESEPAKFRPEQSRARVRQRRVELPATVLRHRDPHEPAILSRLTELHGERERRVEDEIEIVRPLGELPEVLGVELNAPTYFLLKTNIVLIAAAGRQRSAADVAKQPTAESSAAG